MSNEKVFFDKNDILISDKRFVVGSKTYAMKSIVSTQGTEWVPSAFNRLFGAKNKFTVSLNTSSGDVSAYSSEDPEIISDILKALDKAICYN